MKCAIPVVGGMVSPHFGHCEHFAIFEVDEKNGEVTGKELIPSPEHQPGLLPGWLAERGVAVVIAGGMGPRALGLFQQNDIQVVIGSLETDPDKAVVSYISGTLATGDNVCDH